MISRQQRRDRLRSVVWFGMSRANALTDERGVILSRAIRRDMAKQKFRRLWREGKNVKDS